MSFAVNGGAATTAVDADSVVAAGVANAVASVSRKRLKTGLTAAAVTAGYRTSANTGHWQVRWMAVTPVRVG